MTINYIISRDNPSDHPVLSLYGESITSNGGDVRFFAINSIKTWRLFSNDFKNNNRNSNCIVYCGDPIALIMIFPILSSVVKVKVNFLSLEMFEYQLPNNSLYNRIRNFIFKISHRLSFDKSDRIVFSNDLRRQHYIDLYPEIAKKSLVLENYASENRMQMDDIYAVEGLADIRSKYDIVFIYAGSIQVGRELELIISAFSQVEYGKKVCLVVAGNDKMNMFTEKECKHVYYLGCLSKTQLNRVLWESDYGFMFYQNSLLNTRYAAPVKVYEYHSFQLKIISNNNFAMRSKSELIDSYFEDLVDLKNLINQSTPQRKNKDFINDLTFEKKFKESIQ